MLALEKHFKKRFFVYLKFHKNLALIYMHRKALKKSQWKNKMNVVLINCFLCISLQSKKLLYLRFSWGPFQHIKSAPVRTFQNPIFETRYQERA